MSVKRSFDVSDVGTRPTLTSMPLATSFGLGWPFWSRQRLEKKRAALAVREVTRMMDEPRVDWKRFKRVVLRVFASEPLHNTKRESVNFG